MVGVRDGGRLLRWERRSECSDEKRAVRQYGGHGRWASSSLEGLVVMSEVKLGAHCLRLGLGCELGSLGAWERWVVFDER